VKRMREQPANRPPAVDPEAHKAQDIVSQVRDYELITPLFGGGANTGEADEVTLVRATEIRGNLRFWWRACRGGHYKTVAEMKDAEDALWGKAHKQKKGDASQKPDAPQKPTVQVRVEVLKQGQPIKPFMLDAKGQPKAIKGIPGYAAFPLQPDSKEREESKLLIRDVQFRLIISFPKDKEQKEDVEAALWAWETFGGIGARTRRGFGALHLLKIDGADNEDMPDAHTAETWITKKLSNHIKEGIPPQGVPHIRTTSSRYVSFRPLSTAYDAWERLVTKLYKFRQYAILRRSIWPEANAIRAKRGIPQKGTSPGINKFPKAVLGLPLIYHFVNGELEDQTLKGKQKEFERLASPIILRPLLCKNEQAVGVVLLLEGPRIPPGGVVLVEKKEERGTEKSALPVNTQLTREEAQKIEVLGGETDVLKAFMKYITRNI